MILWCTTSCRQHQLPAAAIQVRTDDVHPSTCVHDLGIYVDSDVSMRTQVTRTVVGGFCVPCRLHTIRCSVADSVFHSLVVSLVLNRLDFGNATSAGLPAHQCRRLQSVLNATARLIYRRRCFDHVTSSTRLVTVGDHDFPVAGSRLWNSLPTDVMSATTLPVFCSRLKTYLFFVSFLA